MDHMGRKGGESCDGERKRVKWRGGVNVESMWSQRGGKLDEKGRKRGENGKEETMWSQHGGKLDEKERKRQRGVKVESMWCETG